MIFRGRTFADVGKIRTHAHFAEQRGPFEDVVARRAATLAPFPIDVGRDVIGTNPLTVAIETAIAGINLAAAIGHAGFRNGISISAFLIRLRIEVSDLVIRNNGETDPGKSERPEKSEKEWKQSFHRCDSVPSASTGFKNVGTLAVRPRPKSMRPK